MWRLPSFICGLIYKLVEVLRRRLAHLTLKEGSMERHGGGSSLQQEPFHYTDSGSLDYNDASLLFTPTASVYRALTTIERAAALADSGHR